MQHKSIVRTYSIMGHNSLTCSYQVCDADTKVTCQAMCDFHLTASHVTSQLQVNYWVLVLGASLSNYI